MQLIEILQQHQLEPHTDKNTTHCYVDKFYEDAFFPYKEKNIALLELGISCGASLVLWREYFKNAKFIAGIDNRPEVVLEQFRNLNGISYFYEDAYDPQVKKKLPKLNIIIDDGCHDLDAQLRAMEIYFPLLKKSGIYIVEDIQQQLYPNCYDEFLKAIPDEFKSNHKWLDLRSYKNRPDDTLLIINK